MRDRVVVVVVVVIADVMWSSFERKKAHLQAHAAAVAHV